MDFFSLHKGQGQREEENGCILRKQVLENVPDPSLRSGQAGKAKACPTNWRIAALEERRGDKPRATTGRDSLRGGMGL